MKNICEDLANEYDSLDAMVSSLIEEDWNRTTPFFDWTIRDEISHLSYFDGTALLATTDKEAFSAGLMDVLTSLKPEDNFHDVINGFGRKMTTINLMKTWRKNRNELVKALSELDPKTRLPWYGPDMSAMSFAAARLMETWAHARDVADCLKIRQKPTDRLKNIAHLGVTTFGWSFLNRQLEVPIVRVKVELLLPSGETWTRGPEEADDFIRGDVEDFCLVVTQRRNVADSGLKVIGSTAEKWMSIAQVFAGPPEDGPKPGQRIVND